MPPSSPPSGLATVSHREPEGDVSDQLEALLRLNAGILAVHALMLRADHRAALFQETCRILVEEGGLQAAAVHEMDASHHGLTAVATAEERGQAGDEDASGEAARRGRDVRKIRPRPGAPAARDRSGTSLEFPLSSHGATIATLRLQLPAHLPGGALEQLGRLAQNLSIALERLDRDASRQQEADRLRRDVMRLQDLAVAAGEYAFELDLMGHFTYLSEGIEQVSGYTAQELLGRCPVDLMSGPERERIRRLAAEEMREDGSLRDFEHQLVTRDGQLRWLRVNAVGLFDDSGRRIGQRGTGRDITERKLAEERAEQSRRFLDELINAVPDPISVKDREGRYVAANTAMCGLIGVPRDAVLGHTDAQLLCADAARLAQETDLAALERGSLSYETEVIRHGRPRWVIVRKSALDRSDGARVVVAVSTDITQRRAAEQALRESETRFRDFAHAASEFVWENDLAGRFTYVSKRVEAVWGYAESDLLGRTPSELSPPGEAERVRHWLERNLRPDGSFRDLEQRILTRSGEVRWLHINAVGMFDGHGHRVGQRGAARDITERKQAEARISHLATRDPLTDLPNRVLLNDRLNEALSAARRHGNRVALMFIDLDRFKNINDSLGHDVGDALLRAVATRLSACLRETDTLARLGGDEFVVVLDCVRDAADASVVGSKLMQALNHAFVIGGHALVTSASIGVSCFPGDGDDVATLMRNADTAMYHAKGKGRNALEFFSPEMNRRAMERHQLESALRAALDDRQFRLAYQPQLDVVSGRVVGAEALIRWHHPELGEISPARFVPIAEESGLIRPLGDWVLDTVCEQLTEWRAAIPVRVSINLSIDQLRDPAAFLERAEGCIRNARVDPRRIEFEITETLLASNVAEHADVLRRLGALGCAIAVDDFGTGYSSLSYLKRLPIDTVKIDRSFVRDIVTDPDDLAIVSAVVAMAKHLKLDVVAEGVESAQQLIVLRELGCDRYQGFLFSPAVPAGEFAQRFLGRRATASIR